MSHYVKAFSDLLDSTVWLESSDTRVMWVTMMLTADPDGVVYASVPGLANRARVSREACEEALRVFMAPDPDSRTPDNDGRRIEAVPGGWRLLNYARFRAKLGDVERREQKRAWDRQNRPSGHARRAQSDDGPSAVRHSPSQSVQSDDGPSRSVTVRPSPSQVEVEVEVEVSKPTALKTLARRASRNARQMDEPPGFVEFWTAYPRKEAKQAARKAWNAKGCEAMAQRIVSDVRQRKAANWLDKEPEFIPHPASYINGARWDDPIVYPAPPKPLTGQLGAAADRLRARMSQHTTGLQAVGLVIDEHADDWGIPHDSP